ncbi:DUF2971 domain-containing protein [Agrobacterium rosae]|uniref:DUF2971 domain-containing protein n=1 Tax=Agrobacterium rosae TaxID=1972867 RepID=UPI001356495B|nr:DUF2971 domain-containing protein [Agrobacterium rosae]
MYYYTSQRHGLASIRDKRIKISKFSELNDPFDFIGIATDKKEERDLVKNMRGKLNSKTGLVCMSEVWNEPLLWGHYADKHKGVCLAFEVNETKWDKVQYVDQRPRLGDYGVDNIAALKADNLRDISRKKFKSWSYEKEWRYFLSFKKPDFVDGHYFLDFDDELKLIGVVLGERSTVTKEQIAAMIDAHPSIKIGFARAAFSRFSLILNRLRTQVMVPKKNRVALPKLGAI